MVVGLELDGHRVEAGGNRLVVAQAGAGRHHVEDLDDLGAEAAGELPAPAEGVLAGHPALLVGRGPEREVGEARAGGGGSTTQSPAAKTRSQVGPHVPVDARWRRADPRSAPAEAASSVSGRTPTTTSTMSA